ncbi:MAG: hypothetical protein C0485_11660 [Pirellula sp.]|nr:hypothetical protein [Pirellula sp.]
MLLICASCVSGGGVSASDLAASINALLAIDKEGKGHDDAAPLLRSLVQQPPSALLPLLQGMDQANPLAANWFRGAFESIAARNLENESLPQQELEAFALDRSHSADARQLAFDWLVKVDATAADRLVPGMIDDPSTEFRRAGVQQLLDDAAKANEAKNADDSKRLYGQAFRAALDPDQLDLAFDKLTELGEQPDLKKQLGLLSSWWLIGPFDHRGGIGFNAAYPPETEIELQKKYAGTEGEVSWVEKSTDHRHALLDLNNLLGPHKGAVVYAYQEFESDRDQPVEIRLGTPNGWKLWVNGEPAFAHEEYHQTSRLDQYRTPVMLKAGTNRILLKLCQNEQTQDWAQRFEFQIRVCDGSGTAVLPVAPPASDAAKVTQK